MWPILAVVGAVPVLAVAIGLLLRARYRRRLRAGRITEDDVPPLPALAMRGLIIVVVLVAALSLAAAALNALAPR